jgi:hypothetical protein
MHSLAAAISGKTGKLDPPKAQPHLSIDSDFGDSGEDLLDERPLEELV